MRLIKLYCSRIYNVRLTTFKCRRLHYLPYSFFLMLVTLALGNNMRKRFWKAGEGDTRGGINSLHY